MDNLVESLKLMVVGMCTVLTVLVVIIQVGKLLIKFVNAYVPAEEEKPTATSNASATVSPVVEKAIAEAVNVITNGKGRVEKIEKL